MAVLNDRDRFGDRYFSGSLVLDERAPLRTILPEEPVHSFRQQKNLGGGPALAEKLSKISFLFTENTNFNL